MTIDTYIHKNYMGLRTCAFVQASVMFVGHPMHSKNTRARIKSLYICAGISSIGGTLACINRLTSVSVMVLVKYLPVNRLNM